MLENLGYDATVFIRNENKLNQMLSGNQILKSLELLAKVELANGILTEKQLPVSEVTLKKRRSAKKPAGGDCLRPAALLGIRPRR